MPGPLRELTLHWLNIEATAFDGHRQRAAAARASVPWARVSLVVQRRHRSRPLGRRTFEHEPHLAHLGLSWV